MKEESESVPGDREVAQKSPQDKVERVANSPAARAVASQPVRTPPSWLEMGLVTTGFLAGAYAATFQDMLGCVGLHLAALFGLLAPVLVMLSPADLTFHDWLVVATMSGPTLVWLAPLVLSIFRANGFFFSLPLPLLLLTLLLLLSPGVLITVLFSFMVAGGHYLVLDFLVVLLAALWLGVAMWRNSSHKRAEQASPSNWRIIYAPGLALLLALLLWSGAPMRLSFWLHQSEFERLVTETRNHHQSLYDEYVGYEFSPPRRVGRYHVQSVVMTANGDRGAIRLQSFTGIYTGGGGFYWGKLLTLPDDTYNIKGILPMGHGIRGSPPKFRFGPLSWIDSVSLGGDWYAYNYMFD